MFFLPANELDQSKWDEDWDKSKGAFPFSEKLGEISDKIGSTIDDTLNKFRKKERDDSPDRIRYIHNVPLHSSTCDIIQIKLRSNRCFFPHAVLLSLCHSDNEEDRASRNGRQETLEFKDEEETVTTKSIQITQATETTTTTTRKRSGAAGSKALDLGAAAHYTGDKSPEEKVLAQTLPIVRSEFKSSCLITFSLFLSVVVSQAVFQWRPSRPASDRPFIQSEHCNR